MRPCAGFLIQGVCFFLFMRPVLAQQTIHTYADEVDITSQSRSLTGNVMVFQEELQLFADTLRWAGQELRLNSVAPHQVRVRSPRWLLLAQRVQVLFPAAEQEQLLAETLELTFDEPDFSLRAQSLVANRERWDLSQVSVFIPGVPGSLQAETAYYLPASQSLWLQGVKYYPLFSSQDAGPVISWPDVQWSFSDNRDALRLRPDFLAVQPRFRVGSLDDPWQGLDVGALAEMWHTPNERLFTGLYYGQATGWRGTGIFEWQPTPTSRWLAQGSWQERSLVIPSATTPAVNSATTSATSSAALDYFQAVSPQLWAQLGGYWQQPDTFLQAFGLPLRLSPALYSGAQLILTTPPQTAFEGRLEYIAMLGGQWGTQSRGSALWQGEMALGSWDRHAFSASGQAHLLYSSGLGLSPTVGVRLTDLMAWSPQWTTGLYTETYASTLPVSWFAAGRLSPWVGGLVQWQGEYAAVSMDLAFDPAAGMIRQWNTLTSWRYEQWLLHVGLFLMSEPQAQGGFIGGPRISLQWLL
jgi:hypothetical protein